MTDIFKALYTMYSDPRRRCGQATPLSGAIRKAALVAILVCSMFSPLSLQAGPPPAVVPSASSGAGAVPFRSDESGVDTLRSETAYENATLTEDTTWRGTVLIRGFLVIAPQATVRIEPGTTVRFLKPSAGLQVPRLVVMGRIQANGIPERPILFAPAAQAPEKGGWGGILLLSSEKRNHLEHVRIEGAGTGLEARFSNLTMKGGAISGAGTGLLLQDSTVTLSGMRVSGCGTALEVHDSELDLRESTLADNRQGLAAYRSGLALSSVSVTGSEREGITTEDCRLKFTACDFSGNAIGASLQGGEGRVSTTRFVRNREVGLRLIDARLKVQRCLIADNAGDGLRVRDGRVTVWESAFTGNAGYHLANAGSEEVSAVLNWWGSFREAAISAKIFDAALEPRSGRVMNFPWLSETPAALP